MYIMLLISYYCSIYVCKPKNIKYNQNVIERISYKNVKRITCLLSMMLLFSGVYWFALNMTKNKDLLENLN